MYALFKQLPPLETDPRVIKKCTVKNLTQNQPKNITGPVKILLK